MESQVAIVGGIIAASAILMSGAAWLGSLHSRTNTHEDRLDAVESRLDQQGAILAELRNLLTGLTANVGYIREKLDEGNGGRRERGG